MKNSLKLLLISLMFVPVTGFALTKQETVYSNLDSTGKINSTIVTNHLVDNSTTIEDETELTDILNINGNEKFKLDGSKLTWQTSGSDIFYRGNTSKLLPIDTTITYYLNDKKMSSKDMIGKKGSVKIVLSFKNNLKEVVKVNNTYETLYTPFVVTVGAMLNNDNTNINITNGKVVNTGSKNLLVGISSPGLYESMKLNELKGLDTITITYETTDFSLGNIYVVSTPKLLSDSDLDVFNKLDSLSSSINELSNNMNIIEDGATKLSTGSNTLKTKLEGAIKSLSSDTSDALTDTQVTAIKNQTISLVSSKFTDDYKNNIANSAWEQVKTSLNPNDTNVVGMVTDSVKAAVVEYLQNNNEYEDYVACETGKYMVSMGSSMTPAQQQSCLVIASDTTLPQIQLAATTSSSSTASNVSSYVAENVTKSISVTVALNSAVETASSVSETLSKEVANQVKAESIKQVTKSLGTLYDGVTELDNGITTLSSGITEFNNKGIKVLSGYSSKIQTYSNRLEALTSMSNNYKGYTSSNSDTTLFISMVSCTK